MPKRRHPSVLCSAKTAKSPSRETSLREAIVARYLACTQLFVSLPITSYRGRFDVALKCNSATTPGLLISRYTSASGSPARRQMALPSSQATPMCTCPGLRPRRCPGYSRITHPGLLPSSAFKLSAFTPQTCGSYPVSTTIQISGLNNAACTLASSGFPDTSRLPGLPADVTTDLLARL